MSTTLPPKPLVVAGIMSGTSADGIDVAVCRISPARTAGDTPKLKLLAHRSFPYPADVRSAVLQAMDAETTSTGGLARLHWRLGALYADAVEKTIAASATTPRLIALHGQTVFHETTAVDFLGAPVRSTWQLGEGALLAERFRIPVVSDFRPADLAAGGQGAPLVPMLDLCLFRHPKRNRILLNLGGIANMTLLPAACTLGQVLAFDTGPANMLIDASMEALYGQPFDMGGATAAAGTVLRPVLDELLQLPYFAAAPPKSCGREQFGTAFARDFLARCAGAAPADILATATAFTVETIVDAYRRFAWPHLGQRAPLAQGTDLLISGGGARNQTLQQGLQSVLKPLYVNVKTTENVGLPVEAKEAAAFALLGWLTWHGLPGNLPSATGATRPVVLGRITHA